MIFSIVKIRIARQVRDVEGQFKRSGLRIQFKVEIVAGFNRIRPHSQNGLQRLDWE